MNFRLKDMSANNGGQNDGRNASQGLELDTPYFRRSMAQKGSVGMHVVELRVDLFLEECGISYVKLDEEYDEVRVAKNLNLHASPSMNKQTNVSDPPENSRRSSFSSFNLDNNVLFLRRKTSTNTPNLNSLKESL